MGQVSAGGQRPPAVVFVVSHLQPTLGLERAVLELAELLRPRIPVQIVSLGENGPVDLPDLRGRQDGPDGREIPLTVLGVKRTGWRRSGELLRIRRFARTADPAAVYVCVGVWASIPWLLAATRLTSRTLIWEHSLAREQIGSSRLLLLRARLAAVLYPRARRVICVGAPLAGDVSALNRRISTCVIENPFPAVDPAVFTGRIARAGSRGDRLLAVGSLTRNKNHQLAVRVLAALPAHYTLRIAGRGPQRPVLEQLIDELGVQDRVELLGQIEPGGVTELYRTSDVLIHPSLGETFGYVYFEAADWGIPVVSASHRVAAEFIPGLVPGLLVRPQVAEMAAAVVAAGANGSREPLLRARNARARRFDGTLIADGWLQEIGRVAGSDVTAAAPGVAADRAAGGGSA